MRATVRRLATVGLCAWVVLAVAPVADAFFPLGSYNSFLQLKLARWSWDSFNDADNDGDIAGTDEGIEIFLHGGTNGFTDDELAIVEEAFDVWQNVSTSYAHFMFKGPIADPIPTPVGAINDTLAGVDFMNTVSIQSTLPFVGLSGELPSTTALTFAVDDEYVTIGNYSYWFTGGQIVEADIVVSSGQVRSSTAGVKPLFDLKACVAHEVGVLLGLSATPLNNVQATTVANLSGYVESPAVAVRDYTNTLQYVGATPTMFALPFYVDLGNGQYTNGNADLAPDDIAGVSYLYPRGSQDNFFEISHEARTQTRSGIASIPLPGAHIVAWCDVDNDAATSRVPLFSTMTGLYELQPLMGGYFDLYGLNKTMETIDGQSFSPTYTLTMSPLNVDDVERQSPVSSVVFASILLSTALTGVETPFDQFQSEVFHEDENVFDMDKHDLGTPLTFDRTRNQVISADSEKILATMLPGTKPMFGDRNDVCPLNLTPTAKAQVSALVGGLRTFRDDYLMKTTWGSMLVDTYYQVAPAMARYLLKHGLALRAWHVVLQCAEWLWVLPGWLAVAFVGLATALWSWRRHRKWVAAALLIGLLGAVSVPAHALTPYYTDDEMVARSDAIVTGIVTSVESQWSSSSAGQRGILTDVIVQVEYVAKGAANKDGDIYLRYSGGRVGSTVTKVAELPDFAEGEEVILYLENKPGEGYVLLGGSRGKFVVETSSTGEKYVTGASAASKVAIAATKQAASGDKDSKLFSTEEPRISLDEYKDYLSGIVNRQKNGK